MALRESTIKVKIDVDGLDELERVMAASEHYSNDELGLAIDRMGHLLAMIDQHASKHRAMVVDHVEFLLREERRRINQKEGQ